MTACAPCRDPPLARHGSQELHTAATEVQQQLHAKPRHPTGAWWNTVAMREAIQAFLVAAIPAELMRAASYPNSVPGYLAANTAVLEDALRDVFVEGSYAEGREGEGEAGISGASKDVSEAQTQESAAALRRFAVEFLDAQRIRAEFRSGEGLSPAQQRY